MMDKSKYVITIPFEDYLRMKEVYEKFNDLKVLTPLDPVYVKLRFHVDNDVNVHEFFSDNVVYFKKIPQ